MPLRGTRDHENGHFRSITSIRSSPSTRSLEKRSSLWQSEGGDARESLFERGTYWASAGSIDVSYHRERMATALWAGEGPIYLQTKVSGHGEVIVTTRGPVEEIVLGEGGKVVAEGKHVICRTGDVSFEMQRSTKSYMGRFTSGEGYVRVYKGMGRVLLNPAPYWRYRISAERGKDPDYPARATS